MERLSFIGSINHTFRVKELKDKEHLRIKKRHFRVCLVLLEQNKLEKSRQGFWCQKFPGTSSAPTEMRYPFQILWQKRETCFIVILLQMIKSSSNGPNQINQINQKLIQIKILSFLIVSPLDKLTSGEFVHKKEAFQNKA